MNSDVGGLGEGSDAGAADTGSASYGSDDTTPRNDRGANGGRSSGNPNAPLPPFAAGGGSDAGFSASPTPPPTPSIHGGYTGNLSATELMFMKKCIGNFGTTSPFDATAMPPVARLALVAHHVGNPPPPIDDEITTPLPQLTYVNLDVRLPIVSQQVLGNVNGWYCLTGTVSSGVVAVSLQCHAHLAMSVAIQNNVFVTRYGCSQTASSSPSSATGH